MNDKPDAQIPDEFRDLPTPAESLEAELIRIRQAEGMPLVSQELADHINNRLLTDEMFKEDTVVYDRIARLCEGDRTLADLLIDHEIILSKPLHPSATPEIREKYEAEIREINEKIEARREELEQRRNH